MNNKTATIDQLEAKLGASFSGETLLWFLQRFRAGNNLQRLLLILFAGWLGLSFYYWSIAVFCASMSLMDTHSGTDWLGGVMLYTQQACGPSAFACAIFLSYSVIDSFRKNKPTPLNPL